MTKEELAAQLNGIEYPGEPPKELKAAAKQSGLVIVFGASDDLMEFRGAIDDELPAPGSAFVDARGLTQDFNRLCEDKDFQGLRDYFARFDGRKEIEAVWSDTVAPAWSFKTTIPHATFEIMEDGEAYCRGIVFSLGDLTQEPAK